MIEKENEKTNYLSRLYDASFFTKSFSWLLITFSITDAVNMVTELAISSKIPCSRYESNCSVTVSKLTSFWSSLIESSSLALLGCELLLNLLNFNCDFTH